MFKCGEISFGDNVRIADVEDTRQSGHAGMVGVCYGMTMPSVTGVEVVGEDADDVALNVNFGADVDAWFVPALVMLVDHAVGSMATVGSQSFVKQPDGNWVAQQPDEQPVRRRRRWLRRP